METQQITNPQNNNTYKLYCKAYYDKRKEEPTTLCPICFGSYTYTNYSHHIKTNRHKQAVFYRKIEKIATPQEAPFLQLQESHKI